ncbi:MAG TPA: ABC transporter permease [Bacillota bacterium]|nr:ABC transporter permease [Bacillota bacterium]
MFLKIILYKSFIRNTKEKLLVILIVAFGASLAAVMLNVALDVGDKVNQELKSYGANIQILPKMDTLPVEMDGVELSPLGEQAYLKEEDLLKLKKIFWANNILGFSPYLETTARIAQVKDPVPLVGTWFNKDLTLSDGSSFHTGMAELKTWWKLTGKWPNESDSSLEIVVGTHLANSQHIKPGDPLTLQVDSANGTGAQTFTVSGVIDAGGPEDDGIYAPLAIVQNMMNLSGKISKAEVSALTVPENELAERAAADPSSLRERDFDQWYCTAFAGAISYQIEESILGSVAKPMRQITQSEGVIVNKIQFLMLIISIASVISSALGITSLMNSKVMTRIKEIALMKAIGATDQAVAFLFISEAMISGMLGGLLGYGIGYGLTLVIGKSVFGTVLTVKLIGLPFILLLSVFITVLGSYPALRNIIKLEPVRALSGR